MRKQLFVLCGWIVFAPTTVPAEVQWTKAWASPPERSLFCEQSGGIVQTQAELEARYPAIVGNVQRVADLINQMTATGWRTRGSGASREFGLPYRFVYRRQIRFRVRPSNPGMTTGVFREPGGNVETRINENARKYLTPEKAKILTDRRQGFENRREAEIAAIQIWHNMRHAWTPNELNQLRTRTGGVFSRQLDYSFCGRSGYHTTFSAAWRGSLGADRRR